MQNFTQLFEINCPFYHQIFAQMSAQTAAETLQHFVDDSTVSNIDLAVNPYDLFVSEPSEPFDGGSLSAMSRTHHDKRFGFQLFLLHLYFAVERHKDFLFSIVLTKRLHEGMDNVIIFFWLLLVWMSLL